MIMMVVVVVMRVVMIASNTKWRGSNDDINNDNEVSEVDMI